MPNRTKQPLIHQISGLVLPKPQKHTLSNGIPVYEIRMGTQDIVKLEIIFRAGRPQESKRLVARATARMLREGTKQHSSAELAETVDYYGGTISTPVNLDTSNIVLYSLNKHFEKLLPLITAMLQEPTFPEDELRTYIDNSIQQTKVNLTKSDVVAYREVTQGIFGKDHPYGYNSTVEQYQQLQREDLVQHFKTQYTSGNCFILISGKTTDRIIHLLDQHLAKAIPQGVQHPTIIPTTITTPKQYRIPLDNTLQSAIRIGSRLFNKRHEDYKGLYVLNTVLGGYFGSRLMMNIREEKGYTYNIFSTLDSMVYDGCFYIGTEVGNEHVEKTLSEIYKECAILQEELVPDSELEMVRNYLLGNMLTMLDGPMNISDIIKNMLIEKLPLDDFTGLEQTIQHITAEELRALAQKYLQKEAMWEVIVGA